VNSTGNCFWALSVTLKFDSTLQIHQVDGEENDQPKKQKTTTNKIKRGALFVSRSYQHKTNNNLKRLKKKGACRYGNIPE